MRGALQTSWLQLCKAWAYMYARLPVYLWGGCPLPAARLHGTPLRCKNTHVQWQGGLRSTFIGAFCFPRQRCAAQAAQGPRAVPG